MWVVLQVLRGVLAGQQSSHAAKSHKRHKLQKVARDKGEPPTKDRKQSLLTASSHMPPPSRVPLDQSDNEITAKCAGQPRDTTITTTTSLIMDNVPETPLAGLSNRSIDSLSIYSLDGIAVETLKRSRSKTPCLWIGQLDPRTCRNHVDLTDSLAYEYQAELPPRSFTPWAGAQPLEKTIRKVKGQEILRQTLDLSDLNNLIHPAPQCDCPPRHNYTSDCETLRDSESLTLRSSSQTNSLRSPITIKSKTGLHSQEVPAKDAANIGFQVCLNLLTSQLATGFFKKHPTEHLDRVSSLQILLMIEAYELLLRRIRGTISSPRPNCQLLSHLLEIEHTLEHWVYALYSVYDSTSVES